MTQTLQPSESPVWNLVLEGDSDGGKVFPITHDTAIIGRALTADVPLDDVRISRHHARLTRQGEYLFVEDLNSFNGTLVNGSPVTGKYLLKPQDVINVGPFSLRVEGPIDDIPLSRRETRAYQVQDPMPPGRPVLLLISLAGVLILLTLLGGLGVAWFLTRNRPEAMAMPEPTAVAVSGPTIVVEQGPADHSQVLINQPLAVQATATDPAGVARLELWVNGSKVDEVTGQLPGGPAALTASWQWTPKAAGDYNLEVRAYNRSGLLSLLPVAGIAVEVPATPRPAPTATPEPTATASPTPTARPTATPIPPTATARSTATPIGSAPTPATATPTEQPTATPARAVFTVTVPGLNVRSGPGARYSPVGLLQRGEQVEIVGQGNNGQGLWWQIRYAAAPGGLGWISASGAYGTAANIEAVPPVTPPLLASAGTSTGLPTATATATATPAPTEDIYIRAPAGKALLIVSNRSYEDKPARLTLSGGKSVAGGQEINVEPGRDVQMVLEPDFYRALWSTPAHDNFARGADFTAGQNQVIVMWIKPEDGLTQTEFYYQLPRSDKVTPPPPTATPVPFMTGYTAPPGKALLVVANRSIKNEYGQVTVSGGSFGGGQEIKLEPNTETALELEPADDYRTVWTSPAYGGVNGGREFKVSAGEIILGWIIPEDKEIYMQFPGQPPEQINN